MSMPTMGNTVLAAQLNLFDQLRTRIGHDLESATEIVQQVPPAELFDKDGHVDTEAVAAAASRFPVTDGPAPDDHGNVLLALLLAQCMITGQTDDVAMMVPSDLADLRTLVAAQAWLTGQVLDLTAMGRELDVLQILRTKELHLMTKTSTGTEQ